MLCYAISLLSINVTTLYLTPLLDFFYIFIIWNGYVVLLYEYCWWGQAPVEGGHAALPVLKLGGGANVVRLLPHLLTLSQDQLNLLHPAKEQRLQTLNQLRVVCYRREGGEKQEVCLEVKYHWEESIVISISMTFRWTW